MKIAEIIKPIWIRLVKRPFDSLELAEVMIRDLGSLDMAPLDKADLIEVMEDRFSGNWDNVVFSFSGLLASYSNRKLDCLQVIAWCVAVLIIGEAVRKPATDWELHLYLLTQGFDQVAKTLEYHEFCTVLKVALNPRNAVISAGEMSPH